MATANSSAATAYESPRSGSPARAVCRRPRSSTRMPPPMTTKKIAIPQAMTASVVSQPESSSSAGSVNR